jgi:hypothetical protein
MSEYNIVFNDPLIQLQDSIASIYRVLPVDGNTQYAEFVEDGITKRVIFETFSVGVMVEEDDKIPLSLLCEQVLTTIREQFKLNARLMWRTRPEVSVDKIGGKERKVSVRLRIGELV